MAVSTPLPHTHPLMQQEAIWPEKAAKTGPIWCCFQQTATLSEAVSDATLWLSASQRFRCWLDGELIAEGPARADRERWGLVTLTLPPCSAGSHCLAIEVVHWGASAGKGQIGGPGFLLTACNRIPAWNSSGDWRGIADASRSPFHGTHGTLTGHRAVGDGEALDAAAYPWGWQSHAQDWPLVVPFAEKPANPWGNRPTACRFAQNALPAMLRDEQAWQRRLSEMGDPLPAGPWTCAAHSTARLIFDAGHIHIAYPLLQWSGGKGGLITLTSCEAPVEADGSKDRRDVIRDKELPGQQDCIHLDGGAERDWMPIWFRSYRYFIVDIVCDDEPLVLHAVTQYATGFPLKSTSSLAIEDPAGRDWTRLRAVSWATAQACAHETFFDCPSWEQAQFSGDGRVQARHHYLAGNDDRLAQKAIDDLADGRTPNGLLRSHWPSAFEQIISTYSLQWIGMLYDWMWYRGTPPVVVPHLATARGILDWFTRHIRSDGLLARMDEAPFVDWNGDFHAGCPPQDDDGGSSVISAMLAEAYMHMAALENWCGYPELAQRWHDHHADMTKAIRSLCWDDERQLLADTPTKNSFSVHAQVQASLAECWQSEQATAILRRALADDAVTQPGTFYYRAHVAEALRRAGAAQDVLPLMDHWHHLLRDNPSIGTWPESDGGARSDCHGWGTMPEVELINSVVGITPAQPGFQSIRLQPALADIAAISCSIQLPSGTFSIALENHGDHYTADMVTTIAVLLPNGQTVDCGEHRCVITEL